MIHRDGVPEKGLDSARVLTGRFHYGREIMEYFRDYTPDLTLYIPASGMTGFGLLRTLLLGRSSRSPVVAIAMQYRQMGWLHRIFSLFGEPRTILSPVSVMREQLGSIGMETGFIMPGIDGDLFRPVSRERKLELRRKYSLPEDKLLVLHVGHIKESRNLQVFMRYREWGAGVLPLIKGGEVEKSWRERLRQSGMIVIDQYTDDIHELYQLSDIYLFPVSSSTGALEFPLSVIEAAACGLPVLTTRFGALPDMILEDSDYRYFDNISEIPPAIESMRSIHAGPTAEKVREFTWEKVFDRYLGPVLTGIEPG
ncbi:MAG TPA: glycosyltransferase, partial [Candidatus Krumholzibacterium sp.]|nr:glycosyltransferase [Candidatus Krumholzibacterium sp.]